MRKEGLPSISEESLVEFADNGLVLRGMAEEDAEPSAGFGHWGYPQFLVMVKL